MQYGDIWGIACLEMDHISGAECNVTKRHSHVGHRTGVVKTFLHC